MTRDEKLLAHAPRWYWNFLRIFDWTFKRDEDSQDAMSYYGLLLFVNPTINEFLNTTKVIGDTNAERIVRVFNRLYARFATFYTVKLEPTDGAPFLALHETHKRLNGLVRGMK